MSFFSSIEKLHFEKFESFKNLSHTKEPIFRFFHLHNLDILHRDFCMRGIWTDKKSTNSIRALELIAFRYNFGIFFY